MQDCQSTITHSIFACGVVGNASIAYDTSCSRDLKAFCEKKTKGK